MSVWLIEPENRTAILVQAVAIASAQPHPTGYRSWTRPRPHPAGVIATDPPPKVIPHPCGSRPGECVIRGRFRRHNLA